MYIDEAPDLNEIAREAMIELIRNHMYKTCENQFKEGMFEEAVKKAEEAGQISPDFTIGGHLLNEWFETDEYDPNKWYRFNGDIITEVNAGEDLEDTTDVYEGTEEVFYTPDQWNQKFNPRSDNGWDNRQNAFRIKTKKGRAANKLARKARRNNR